MKWVLIFFYFNFEGMMTSTAVFDDEPSCIHAAKTVRTEIKRHLDPERVFKYVCVPQGGV